MCKRILDIIASSLGLIALSPILLVTLLLVYLHDRHSPIYIAPRMRNTRDTFNMFKFRSMVVNADQIGGTSTAGSDDRITWIGKIIRKWKLDEFSQLWNVLIGDMSLVGPRPQAPRDAKLYTELEDKLFDLKPGITDFASIVFSDEGEILAGSENPDLKYNQVIRPWKSRLGLFYIQKRSFIVDLKIIVLTIVSIISRATALEYLSALLKSLGADERLIQVSRRCDQLLPYPPPGTESIESRY